MASDSDPDYNPLESEDISDDDDDDKISSGPEPRESTKIYRQEGSDSYSSPENSKKVKLVQKLDDRNDRTLGRLDPSSRIIKKENMAFMFHCSFCYFQTPLRHYLKGHIKTCRQSNPRRFWECPKCNIKYNLGDLLHEHSIPKDLATLDRHVFYCPVCSSGAKKKSEAPILEKIFPSNRHYTCPNCKKKLDGPNGLKRHLMTEHDVPVLYKCEYCEFFSPECDTLLEHKKSHTALQEMGLIQCSHCHFEFLTMKEVKEHMKKVNYEKIGKELKKDLEEDTKEFIGEQQRPKEGNDFDEEKVDDETTHDDIDNLRRDSVDTAGIAKWELRCTLCEYVNYSKASCQRHVKNKHRSTGYPVVEFDKYYENEFKGSIKIGKIEGDEDAVKSSTQELLKILDWTQSDGEDIAEQDPAADNTDHGEVITIEMASDTEDEENKEGHLQESGRDDGKSSKSKEEARNVKKSTGLTCKECSYQARNRQHLSIHQQLLHDALNPNRVFKCPQKLCKYTSKKRTTFRNHLRRNHNVKIAIFYPSDMKCPNCEYTAKQPHHLLLHKHFAHKCRPKDPQKGARNSEKSVDRPRGHLRKDTGKSKRKTSSDRGRPNLEKYTESTNDTVEQRSQEKSSIRGPSDNSNSSTAKQGTERSGGALSHLKCKQCGLKYQEMYSLAWHMFKSHNNTAELRKWRLKCKQCSFESYSKPDCHKHGMQHKISLIKFQKYYVGKLKGAIGFRYDCSDDQQQSKSQDNIVKRQKDHLQLPEQVFDGVTVPKEVKEEAAYLNDENIADETKPTGNELGDGENDDVVLFSKKEEFFTCRQCNYETKHESYIPMHEVLVHQPQITVGKARYHCGDCIFKTKYRHSFRRHLDRMHRYDTDEFYTKEQATLSSRKPKERKIADELRISHNCRLCVFVDQDKYMLDWHMSKAHGDNTDLVKWKIRCSLCEFESWSKSDARFHVRAMHRDYRTSKTIKLVKYYDNKFYGYFDCKLGDEKVLRCSKCNYEASSWEYLKRHHKYCPGLNQEENSMATKRENAEFDSESGGKYEETEGLEDARDNREDEVIKIEIAPDTDEEEINENQDLSESDVEYEHYERLPDEDLNVPKRGERHHDNVGSDSDDQDAEDLSEIDEELQQTDEDGKGGRISSITRKDEEIATSEDLCNNDEELKKRGDDDRYSTNSKRRRFSASEDESNNAEDQHRRSTRIKKISSKNDEDYDASDSSGGSDHYLNADKSHDTKKLKTDLPANVSIITNKCLDKLCNYKSQNKSHLKRHCIRVHCYGRKKMDQFFPTLDQYKCELCKFQSATLRAMNKHCELSHKSGDKTETEKSNSIACTKCINFFPDRYKLACHMFRMHRDDTELLKWTLRCTLCSYEHHWAKYANGHGIKHTSTTEPTVVQFQKFYENKFEGTLSFEYGIRTLHRCTLCDYVAGTWECLRKHLKRHKKKKLVPAYRPTVKKTGSKRRTRETVSVEGAEECKFKSSVCPRKETMSDKHQWANHMFEVHGDVTEIMKCNLKCPLCSYETHYTRYAYQHGKAHTSTTTPTVLNFQKKYEDKEEGFYICRYGPVKLQHCNLCEFVTTRRDSLRRHFQRHKTRTATFRNQYKMVKKAGAKYIVEESGGGMDADPDGDETKMDDASENDAGSYSHQQILDIIGLGKQRNNDETEEGNSKLSEDNEVITIEITQDDNTGPGNKIKSDTTTYSSDEEDETYDYKCNKTGCTYSSDSLQEITDHIKLCAQDILMKYKNAKKFTCLLCKKVLTYRNSMQIHTNAHAATLDDPDLTVTFSEFTNDKFTCGIELKANSGGLTTNINVDPRKANVTYKCCLCASVIITKKTLTNHTQIHARDDDNPRLKVRYSKFSDGQLEGTIIMHSDPNYVTPKKKRVRTPEPEYDPSLPVFSCKECNFKSNEETALNKHKNLHWTPEKEAQFRAKNWFTCNRCSFHCFDVEKYKKHCKWHKAGKDGN